MLRLVIGIFENSLDSAQKGVEGIHYSRLEKALELHWNAIELSRRHREKEESAMKPSSVLTMILLALSLGACAKGGGTAGGVAPSVPNTLTYQVATPNGATIEVEDLAYVEFAKSRLIVADFNVCFRIISLTDADLADIQAALVSVSLSSTQAQATAACASSTDTYKVISTRTNSTYQVCGTQLQTTIEAIIARPGTRLCKAL